MSLPEVLLWQRLKGKVPTFRRQVAMSGYILDLYCPAARLAVEIDGSQHELSGAYDAARTEALATVGVTVRRISAREVLQGPDAVATFCLALAMELIAVRDESY